MAALRSRRSAGQDGMRVRLPLLIGLGLLSGLVFIGAAAVVSAMRASPPGGSGTDTLMAQASRGQSATLASGTLRQHPASEATGQPSAPQVSPLATPPAMGPAVEPVAAAPSKAAEAQAVGLAPPSALDSEFIAAFKDYARLHSARLAGTGGQTRATLTCEPSAQMGNRIRFVASCLLLAMVSDRAVVVRFKQGYYASLADLFESPGFGWEDLGAGVPSGRGIDPKDSQQLLCGDLGPAGAGAALSVSGNYYFMPFVANNPLYRAKTRRWFPNGDIFGTMARVVFRPGPEVRAMMDTLLLDLGAKAGMPKGERWTCELGFQIRNDNDPVHHPQISSKEWELYRKCADELLPRDRRKDPRVFVATDSDPSRKICSKEVPYPFEVYGDFERSNNPKGVRKALVDLLVFSTCDIMMTSPWSSYGRVASVYAGREAYFVTDWGVPTGEPHRKYLDIMRDEDGRSGCFRFLRTEPCPWQGPKGVLGFNDVLRKTTCWDASMFSDVC